MFGVAWLSIAPVKGLALLAVEEVELLTSGVADNRRFHLVDERGELYNALGDGRLLTVVPDYDGDNDVLTLRFPDGSTVSGSAGVDGELTTDFYGRLVPGRLVVGPWGAALSSYCGKPIRVVRSDVSGAAVDRGNGAVSLVSEASVAELSRRSGTDVDPRRFRMLVGLRGCTPHEEDEWLGRRVRLGEAVVRPLGTVARCAITTRNPDTGHRDFATLRAISAYRVPRPWSEGIDFGVYGEVVEPGRVRVGDEVEPLR